MSKSHSRLSLEGLLLLLALAIGWGINWPIMKFILSEIPPLSFRGFCLLTGGLGILILARIQGRSLRIPKIYWGKIFWICLFNIFAWNLMATYGLSFLPAGRSALLGYTMPIWAVLLSIWILKDQFTFKLFIALLLGMAGIFTLMSDNILHWSEQANHTELLIGALLMLGAAWCWALGTNLMKFWALPVSSVVLTGWLLLTASIPMLVAAVIVDGAPQKMPSQLVLWGVIYNVTVAFMFCYWAWVRIIEITPVTISSLSSLLTPLVGVFSSIWLLHETPGWPEYVAAGLILGAVLVVNLQNRTSAQRNSNQASE
jgi:drug/metabolite transporter (DMT)-like permease